MQSKFGNLAQVLTEELVDSALDVPHASGIYASASPLNTPGQDEATVVLANLQNSSPRLPDFSSDSEGETVTREQRRSRRKRDVRARTISVKRMTKRELEMGRLLYPDMDGEARPVTREACVGGQRPCPYVSCKHHLFLDVSARTGAIKLNFPDLEVWDMQETCALDVSDRGGTTLEEVGAIMNLTRERIRQVEVKGLAKLQALKDMSALRDYIDEGPVGKRRLPVINKPVEVVDEDAEDDDDFSDEDADLDNESLPTDADIDVAL
jgi:Sigma-70, region 4